MRAYGSRVWIAVALIGALVAVTLIAQSRSSVGVEPETPEQVLERAALLTRTGRQEEAAHLLRRGVEVHPDRPDLHSRLGYVLRYTGLLEESIASYQRGLELDGSPAARVSAEGQIAKSLVYLGDYADALALQQGLHHHLAEIGQAADEKMLFYEGIMYLYRGEYGHAVRLFDESYAADSLSLWSSFAQAYRHAVVGDTVNLSRLARTLATRDVADGERHYRLVHFHALAGEEREAVARLRAATAAGFFNYAYASSDPLTASMRGSPSFDAALAEMRARYDAFQAGWQKPASGVIPFETGQSTGAHGPQHGRDEDRMLPKNATDELIVLDLQRQTTPEGRRSRLPAWLDASPENRAYYDELRRVWALPLLVAGVVVMAAGSRVPGSYRLLREHHVAVVRGSAFGSRGEGLVRITCVKSWDDLREGVRRIRAAVS